MQLTVRFEAVRDSESDPEELELTHAMQCQVFLAHFVQQAALDIEAQLCSAGLLESERPAALAAHLRRWVQRVEATLLECCAARQIPGSRELRDSKLPQVEIVEALRDESGRMVATVRRRVPEEVVHV